MPRFTSTIDSEGRDVTFLCKPDVIVFFTFFIYHMRQLLNLHFSSLRRGHFLKIQRVLTKHSLVENAVEEQLLGQIL